MVVGGKEQITAGPVRITCSRRSNLTYSDGNDDWNQLIESLIRYIELMLDPLN
jgi:hypothetical protein